LATIIDFNLELSRRMSLFKEKCETRYNMDGTSQNIYHFDNKSFFVLKESLMQNGQIGFYIKLKENGEYKFCTDVSKEEIEKEITKYNEFDLERLFSRMYFKCYCIESKLPTTFYLNGSYVNTDVHRAWQKRDEHYQQYILAKNKEDFKKLVKEHDETKRAIMARKIQTRIRFSKLGNGEKAYLSIHCHNNIVCRKMMTSIQYVVEFRKEFLNAFNSQTKFKTLETFLSHETFFQLLMKNSYFYQNDYVTPTKSFISREFSKFKALVIKILKGGIIQKFTKEEMEFSGYLDNGINKKYSLEVKNRTLYERFSMYFTDLVQYFDKKFDLKKFKNYYLSLFNIVNKECFPSVKFLGLYKVYEKLQEKVKKEYDERTYGWHTTQNGAVWDTKAFELHMKYLKRKFAIEASKKSEK